MMRGRKIQAKTMIVGIIIGLLIGVGIGYILALRKIVIEAPTTELEQRISELEAQIKEKDSLIAELKSRMEELKALIITPTEGRIIVDTTITLTDLKWYRDYYTDLKKDEVVHVQFIVTPPTSPIDFDIYSETEGKTLVTKADALSEDFTWTVPEDGRYVFTLELADEYASVMLKITVK